MNIRSIMYARSINLGGGDRIRYSAMADVGADEDPDAATVQLAAMVNGWLHDRLAAHYRGELSGAELDGLPGRGSDQT